MFQSEKHIPEMPRGEERWGFVGAEASLPLSRVCVTGGQGWRWQEGMCQAAVPTFTPAHNATLCHVAVPGPFHQGINGVFVHSSQSATALRTVCAMEACTATASASVPRAGLGTTVKPDWVRDAQLFPGTHLLFPGTRCHVAAFPGAG